MRKRIALILLFLVASAQTPVLAQQVRPKTSNYVMPTDVQAVGGGEAAKSTNYVLNDTIGEVNIGPSRGSSYDLNAGYRQTADGTYIALGCNSTVSLGTITGHGQATGSGTCLVTTDADAGYNLSWSAGPSNSGLVGYWKMDETAGTTAFDYSGYGNNGTLTNGPTISTTVPNNLISTRSVSFDGTDDVITIPNAPPLNVTTAYTVSFWTYVTSDRNYDVYFARATDGTASDIEIYSSTAGQSLTIVHNRSNGGTFEYTANNTFSGVSGAGNWGDVPLNAWTHVAVTYNNGTLMVYFNGVQVGNTVTGLTPPLNTSKPINLGGQTGFASTTDFLSGNLDEVRLYNRALDPAEVIDLASKSPPGSMVASNLSAAIPPYGFPSSGNLLGHWKLDEPSGTTTADSSGNGTNGTLTNGPVISTVVPANSNVMSYRSLAFDGINDYVDMGDVNAMDGLTRITVAGWARWTGTVSNMGSSRSIARKQGSTGVFALGAGWDVSANKAKFWINNGSWSNSGDGTTNVADGNWHHIAGTYDGNVIRVYVDGVQENAATIGATTLSSTTDPLRIGGYSGAEYWQGNLDDIRVYGRALTAAQISALASVPQTWTVTASGSSFGGRVRSVSTDIDSKWAADGGSSKWLNIGNGSYSVVSRTTRTAVSGSTEILQFRAEIGTTAIVPNATYTSTVTMTATSL